MNSTVAVHDTEQEKQRIVLTAAEALESASRLTSLLLGPLTEAGTLTLGSARETLYKAADRLQSDPTRTHAALLGLVPGLKYAVRKLENELMAARSMLNQAAGQFEAYRDLHRAKSTPDGDEKAKVNDQWATACRLLGGASLPPPAGHTAPVAEPVA